jgi:hypothetical protein
MSTVEFDENGEWRKSRFFVVQYQHIAGHALDEFKDPAKMAALDPPEFKSGTLIYPYAEALK